tara:strand:+ start:586 stop:1086 length:501 start_codon:yes stop_codon:yes gene_type:complete
MAINLPNQAPRLEQLQIASSNSLNTANSSGEVNPFVLYEAFWYQTTEISQNSSTYISYLQIPLYSDMMSVSIQANLSFVDSVTPNPTFSRAFNHYIGRSGTDTEENLEYSNDTTNSIPYNEWFFNANGSSIINGENLEAQLPLTSPTPINLKPTFIIQGIVKIFVT